MPRLARLLGKIARRTSAKGRAAPPPAPDPLPPGGVEALLASQVARARTAWPKLDVDPARFTDRLRVLAAGPDPLQSLGTLRVEDLYLACACLDRVPGAAEQFQAQVRAAVASVLRRVGGASDLQDEIVQTVLARFLVGAKERGPALADYQGRGDLDLFLRIAAQRLALNDRRDSRTRHRLLDRLAEEADQHQSGADQLLAKGKFRKSFRDALRDAIARLSPRDRGILRLHLVGRMSTRRLATLYKVNQATVSRWLANAREAVWADVRRELRASLRLDTGDVDSVLRAVRRDRDVSLSSILTESRDDKDE